MWLYATLCSLQTSDPDDYRGVMAGRGFLPGEFVSKTVDIQLNDDLFKERDETFNVIAESISVGVRINGNLQRDTLRVTILDNESECVYT